MSHCSQVLIIYDRFIFSVSLFVYCFILFFVSFFSVGEVESVVRQRKPVEAQPPQVVTAPEVNLGRIQLTVKYGARDNLVVVVHKIEGEHWVSYFFLVLFFNKLYNFFFLTNFFLFKKLFFFLLFSCFSFMQLVHTTFSCNFSCELSCVRVLNIEIDDSFFLYLILGYLLHALLIVGYWYQHRARDREGQRTFLCEAVPITIFFTNFFSSTYHIFLQTSFTNFHLHSSGDRRKESCPTPAWSGANIY